MSGFDFINYLMLNDAQTNSEAQDHLGDLRDRRDFIMKKTGAEPKSWYEYKQENPPEKTKPIIKFFLGAAIGAAMGLALALALPTAVSALPIVLSIGLTGGMVGIFSDTKNIRRNDLVQKYETYLDNFEHSQSLGRGREQSQSITYRDDFAKNITEEKMASNLMLSGR